MNNNLQENFKLLVNYNTKLTLTENKQLNEDAIGKEIASIIAKDGKLAISDVAKNWLRELPSVKGQNFESFLKGFGGLSKEAKQAFVGDLLKNTSSMRAEVRADATVASLIDKASESLSKQLASNGTDLAKEFNAAGGKAQQKLFLKNKGYRPDVIEKVMGGNIAKDFKTIGSDSKTFTKATEEIVAASGKSEKEIKQLIKQDSFFTKKKKYFTDLFNKLKSGGISKETLQRWKQKGFLNSAGKISWKKVALWAVAIGVGYNVLKDMLNKNGVPIDNTDTGGGTGGSGGGTGGSGGGTGGSAFKECTDFPYKKGCSSSVVSEVQKCLGLSADGKFGSKTEQALTAGGYGTEITKEVYDKIKEKCGTGGTTTTTTVPAPEFQQLDVRANEITW